MKLSERRLRQIIKEEVEEFSEAKITVTEADIDLNPIQKGAEEVAEKLMSPGGALDKLIDQAALALVKDVPDMLPVAKQLIQQYMAQK